MTTVRIAVYGDSISTGTHGDGGYLGALAGVADDVRVWGHAVGGSSLAAVAPGSLVDVLADPANLHPDADLALLWHGTNDWYWGSPLGAPDSPDPRTFRGALAHGVRRLRGAAPGLRVVVPGPLCRRERPADGPAEGDAFVTPNRVGATLGDYRRVLRDAAPDLGDRFLPLDGLGDLRPGLVSGRRLFHHGQHGQRRPYLQCSDG